MSDKMSVCETFINAMPASAFAWLKQPASAEQIKEVSVIVNRTFATMLTSTLPDRLSSFEEAVYIAGWKAMRSKLQELCTHNEEEDANPNGFCNACFARENKVNEEEYRKHVVRIIRDDLKSHPRIKSAPKTVKDSRLNFLTITLDRLLLVDAI